MRSEIENVRKLVGLLSDEGFVNALTNAENLVRDGEETLERVERIEREANEALYEVDDRLKKVDETLALIEAKVEAGFTVVFFAIAANRYLEGDVLAALVLGVLGLMGISSLIVTIATLPHIRRLRNVGEYATDRIGGKRRDRATSGRGKMSQDRRR